MGYERRTVIDSLLAATRDAPAVLALWESGSDVFGRTDEYSDIDLEAVIAPGQVEAVAGLLRAAIAKVAPVAHEYRQENGQGQTQFFWQCDGAPALNYVDMTLLELGQERLRLGAHGEGKPIVHFDKCGCLRVAEETPQEMRTRVQRRVKEIAATFELHPLFVQKHIRRGHVLHAYGQYQRMLIQPLIELLRIKHCPQRSSWHTTYIAWDLPAEINERLRPLVMVGDLDQIDAHLPVILAWGKQLIDELANT